MASSNIRVGQSLRLTVRFADFDFSTGTDELLDPTSVTLALEQYNMGATPSWGLISNLGPVLQDATGIYHYDWTTPSDGRFRLTFTGTLPGATPAVILDTRIFYVGTSVPTVILDSPIEFTFLGELTPLYLDPEIIKRYFPDVDMVEATESIYRISLQLDEWFGPNFEVTVLMKEYIAAAVLCDLSKMYLIEGGIYGFGQGENFTLGDLTINNPGNTGAGFDGNASSWCELAYVLSKLLISTQILTTYKPIVKGSNFFNPIPCRQIRRFER